MVVMEVTVEVAVPGGATVGPRVCRQWMRKGAHAWPRRSDAVPLLRGPARSRAGATAACDGARRDGVRRDGVRRAACGVRRDGVMAEGVWQRAAREAEAVRALSRLMRETSEVLVRDLLSKAPRPPPARPRTQRARTHPSAHARKRAGARTHGRPNSDGRTGGRRR